MSTVHVTRLGRQPSAAVLELGVFTVSELLPNRSTEESKKLLVLKMNHRDTVNHNTLLTVAL